MSRRDWLLIGLRLLGVYFGVVGVATLLSVGMGLIALSREDTAVPVNRYGILGLFQPLVYVIAAFYLTRLTEQVAGWLGEPGEAKPEDGLTAPDQPARVVPRRR